jgi:hypothetical protein
MSNDSIDRPARGHAAVFEARECGVAVYNGVNRRRGHRRNNTDRRLEMRFELEKPDRREKPGRREGDKRPSFW